MNFSSFNNANLGNNSRVTSSIEKMTMNMIMDENGTLRDLSS